MKGASYAIWLGVYVLYLSCASRCSPCSVWTGNWILRRHFFCVDEEGENVTQYDVVQFLVFATLDISFLVVGIIFYAGALSCVSLHSLN